MKIHHSLLIVISLILFTACTPDKPKMKKTKIKSKTELPKKKSEAASSSAPAAADTASDMPAENIEKAKAIIASVDMDAVEAADGKKIFKKYCSVCHGFKGDMKMNGAKDLRKLRTSLEKRVAQVHFGKGLMTPFKGVLNDAEIVAVAKYVKELRK